jgi:alcohol dehydrogenase YqhD (iron-dependent ADH family)
LILIFILFLFNTKNNKNESIYEKVSQKEKKINQKKKIINDLSIDCLKEYINKLTIEEKLRKFEQNLEPVRQLIVKSTKHSLHSHSCL